MNNEKMHDPLSGNSDKSKLFIKALIIFAMVLGLWLPSNIIHQLVKERAGRQQEAINDISNKWAGKQSVTGPVLVLPYLVHAKNEKGVAVTTKEISYFLPDKSDMSATVFPEKRYRGIYQVIVYRSDVSITGKFNRVKWEQLKVEPSDILWDEAVLIFKVEDNIRGINEDLFIEWGSKKLVFNPQAAGVSAFQDALMTPVELSPLLAAEEHTFTMNFSLNGSQELLFAASARENKIEMKGTWPDPGFTGVKLPDSRKVDAAGFSASWKYMNRSVPMVWKNNFYQLSSSQIGTGLLIPVDSYDKTERSVKYALLCIILTFASFFLIERMYNKNIHLVQYGLAGLALVLFYTLLLSVSEYLGFNLAYGIATVATIGLVGWFVGSILKSTRLAGFISFVLAVVYGYLFSIIQLQDYSLLMGSIGLFISLGIIMYFTRKIQW